MKKEETRFELKLFLVVLTIVVIAFFISSKIIQKQEDTHSAMNKIMESAHLGIVGEIKHTTYDPNEFLSTWNFNNLREEERAKYYRENDIGNGTKLREYWIYAEDTEIEIAPGVFYAAWTYNGQVPAPTIRATEGDIIRIHFTNSGSHPHTMHFHGFHPSGMDGAEEQDFVGPGETFTYKFTAEPAGTHLYHCHSTPLKKHLEKGLYGAFIVDPKNDTREKPDKEFIMVLNAFDTNFDGENEIYAVNTEAFAYVKKPIKVKKDELVRIYVINVVEEDPVNSIHVHGNFFYEYPTGTQMTPTGYTDIIELGQGERSIIDITFKTPGKYMFHAHQTEFSEKGWMGFFEVE